MPTPGNVWIIGDGKPGHENQSLGIADQLGAEATVYRVPYQRGETFYGLLLWAWLGRLPAIGPWLARWGYTRLRNDLTPPLPVPTGADAPRLVLATGTLPLPVLLMLKRGYGVRTVAVMAVRPYKPGDFDAHVRHRYGPPSAGGNIIEVLGAPGRETPPGEDPAFLEQVQAAAGGRPVVGVLMGGNVIWDDFGEEPFHAVAAQLLRLGHPCLVTTSRRTPAAVEDQLATLPPEVAPFQLLAGREQGNPIPAFLRVCKVCVVTADSVSMISECLTAQVPVVAVRVWDDPAQGRAKKFETFLRHLQDEGFLWLCNPAQLPDAVASAMAEGMKHPFPMAAREAAQELRAMGLWP